MKRILFWVPQSGQIGLGISVMSYAGTVSLGIVVDESLTPDPEQILEAFKAEFSEMAKYVEGKEN